MRLTATALATILAVLVISETRPTLSGRSSVPPCEVASQVPTIPTPSAPVRLRIIKGLEEQFEDLFVSGPNAGTEPDYYGAAAAPADPHAYYFGLASRPDCFAAYSLRDSGQVDSIRLPKTATSIQYLYPSDPDPRRQDAARVRIPEGAKGADGQLRVSAGPSKGANVFLTLDVWYGKEWNAAHSRLSLHKETPLSIDRGNDKRWAGMRSSYQNAQAHTHNLPPGGPYVTMVYGQAPKGFTKTSAGWYMDTMSGFPRLNLPYTAPAGDARNYNEGIAPVDTTAGPEGAETGIVGERWHRIWHYFERAPAEDWINETTGEEMQAYKWSYWLADTVRNPIRMLNEAIIGIPVSDTSHVTHVTIANHGAGQSNIESLYIGRGDLTAYYRNLVVLHGTRKADVLTMLQKPVN
jgi:hypothetical protein